jgi:hypothetical protein
MLWIYELRRESKVTGSGERVMNIQVQYKQKNQ